MVSLVRSLENRTKKYRSFPIITTLLTIVAACLALAVSDYSLFQLTRVLTLAIAVLGLNLLTGFTGQISIGQGALFGAGAYGTAILIVKMTVPYGLAVLIGMVVTGLIGVLIGLPALRIRGLYLALLTLGLAVMFPPILKQFPGLTGGVYGLNLQTPAAPLGLPLVPAQWMYLLSLLVFVLCMILVRNLTSGRTGRSLHALRTNELLAMSNGVAVGSTKIAVFGISAALAGVGGGLFQLTLGATTPDSFTILLSLSILTATALGGARSFFGAVIGAAFVTYVPDQAAALGDSVPQLVYAIALLLVVYMMPGGVTRLPGQIASYLSSRSPMRGSAKLSNEELQLSERSENEI